jgi:arylsulfatase A-like enzyme
MKSNVFFLLIDSLREDEFRNFCKSHPNSNFKNLMENGIYFSQSISQADSTLLSLSSIFTGLFPFKTGIRSEKFNKFSSGINTFFGNLKKSEYAFYGYYPTAVDLTNILPQFQNDDSGKFSSPCITKDMDKKILKLLANLNSPWFVYLHCMDLHDPIHVPKKFDDKNIKTIYQKQIMAIDKIMGNIIKKIDLEKTIFILTSDHGTYLKQLEISNKIINFEHNSSFDSIQRKIGKRIPKKFDSIKNKVFFNLVEQKRTQQTNDSKKLSLTSYQKRNLLSQKFNLEHNLFDELVRVPLIFAGCGVEKNKIIDTQVRSVDIFPTLLSILNLKFDEKSLDGKNLLPLLNSKKLDELIAYFETNPLLTYESKDSVGIRTSDYKFFRDKNDLNSRIHLYDLKNDPYENYNIFDTNKNLVQKFENQLSNSFNTEYYLPQNEKSELIEKELKKLGYF